MIAKFQLPANCIFLLLVLCGCQPTPVPAATFPIPTATVAPPTFPAPTLSSGPVGQPSLLVSLDAYTFIKRDGWHDYQPIGFGAIVYPTDLLRTEGHISLLCADLRTVKTSTGVGRDPCPLPTKGGPLSYDGMSFDSSTRSAARKSIPYILYPRGTAILESLPVLRWNNTGASSYKVEIRYEGGDMVWQQTNVPTDSVTYPTDAPALQPAGKYLLVVTDNDTGTSSSSDPNKGLGFQVVGAELRAEIDMQRDAISNLTGLDASAQNMILGLYFDQIDINGRGLWGEAVALFEEVTKVQRSAPAVHLHSGASLARMKLWSEAQSAYELALSQAKTLHDPESQADALVALWQITGNELQYEQAMELYEGLGALDKADAIKQENTP